MSAQWRHRPVPGSIHHRLLLIVMGASMAIGCTGQASPPPPASTRGPVAATPSRPPSPTPAATAPATASPTPTSSAPADIEPEAATLLSYLPPSWTPTCVGGPSLVENAVADLTCFKPVEHVILVGLIEFDVPTDAGLDEAGAYGDVFNPYGEPACDTVRRRDGDLRVGGELVGSAGGCTDDAFFVFTLDNDHLFGRIVADSFAAARAAFTRFRPFPATYQGVISGPAFEPARSFAALRKAARTPSYETLVHENARLQGREVYFAGEVAQFTTAPDAPFTVLVEVVKGNSGLYIGGPIGLVSYAGVPLTPGDAVEFVGTVIEMTTYESVGGLKTIPTVEVIALRLRP